MVWGPAGIGKTRLVAELAAEVQREGAAVLYAGGGEVAEAALATVARGRHGPPTDAAGVRLRRRRPARACSRPPRRSPARPRVGRSWSASFITTSRARPPSPACSRAASPNACASTRLTRMRRPRSPRSTRPPRGSRCPCETLIAESDGVPLRIHRAAQRAGRGRRRRERLEADGRPSTIERPGLRTDRGRGGRAASWTCSSPESGGALRARRAARSLGSRGLPLPRPGPVRRRPRRVLLRPRAPGRRAGRPPGRLDPARRRRSLGERQVLGRARRPPAGARGRRRPGLRAAGGAR